MKDIWNLRDHNWNKATSIIENFEFILLKKKLIKKNEKISEKNFKTKISKLEETINPKIGDIITIETRENPNIIKYAGIYITDKKILHKEYGYIKIDSKEELIKEYSSFHKDILDNNNIEIKYYTQEKL